nr:4-hydroxy-3-methylbut-2-enyl diphosphate reductase [Actinomycetospora chiangmaiensis]
MTPLTVERWAVPGARRSGAGPRRAARTAAAVGDRPRLVAGAGGALVGGIAPGDLVVASEVRGPDGASVALPTAPVLAAALRATGLTVHVGPVVSADHVVTGAERARLSSGSAPDVSGGTRLPPVVSGGPPLTGAPAVAVDTESSWLVSGTAPSAVVRAIVDTPDHPLLRPGTVRRGLTALRSLRRAAPVLRAWCDATGEREVLLAAPRSFCAGVDRAIATVERALDRHGAPVYVRRQIVHNDHVVAELERRGAVFVREADEVPTGAVLVLAAHGVAPAVRHTAAERRLRVVDATCPLVTKVHAGVRRHAHRGATVLLIGHAGHEEVEGTVGEAPDDVVVVGSVAEAETVAVRDPAAVATAVQTTLAVDEAEAITAVLRRRFPALAEPRTADICYATTNRQDAVRAVAAEADRLVVVGSPHSSNSVRLAEVGARAGVPAVRIDHAAELDLSWLAGARRVAVTAGASAPEHLVDDVVAVLGGLGPVTVTPRSTTTEDVRFTLPQEVS